MSTLVEENCVRKSQYVMCRGVKEEEFDGDWEKVAALIKDVLFVKACSRTHVCRVINLLSQYSQWLNVEKIFEHISQCVREFGDAKLATIKYEADLNGVEEFVKLWNIYSKSWEKVKGFLEIPENRSMRVEAHEFDRFRSYKSDDPDIYKNNIQHIIMTIGMENILHAKERMITSIFKYVASRDADMERAATLVNQISSIISDLESNLGKFEKEIYKSVLEEGYASAIEKFYHEDTHLFILKLSCEEYIQKCIDIVDYELGIVERILPDSVEAVWEALRKSFIYDHLDILVPKFKSFIKFDQPGDLKKIYNLSKKSDEIMKALQSELQLHEETIFCDLRKSCEVSNFCESFAARYHEELKYIANVFDSIPEALSAFHKGLSVAINKVFSGEEAKQTNQKSNITSFSQTSDLIVNYCDQFMRTGTKGLNESALEKKLDEIIFVFRYLEDKDLFSKLYSKNLAKRLIHSLSQSVEAEEALISKLKTECGINYVKSLERMITDNQLSKDMTTKFNNEHGAEFPISISLLVIQSGSWPIQPTKSTLLVPQKISGLLSFFAEYYSKNHNGRKLNWHHGLSTCDIKLNYLKKSCILQTPVTVTAILSIFNHMASAEFKVISSFTGIEANELLKYLQFLSNHEIISSKDGNNVTQESEFSLNCKYESKRAKFKLMPVLREAAQEATETTRAVVEERKFYLQALIVRIMKGKKTMTHKDLVSEVIQESMTHFVPSQVFVKGVIEDLIQKEYLERSEYRNDEYNYVA